MHKKSTGHRSSKWKFFFTGPALKVSERSNAISDCKGIDVVEVEHSASQTRVEWTVVACAIFYHKWLLKEIYKLFNYLNFSPFLTSARAEILQGRKTRLDQSSVKYTESLNECRLEANLC